MSGPGEDNVAGAPRLEVQDERELGEGAWDMRLLLQQQQAWLAQQQQQQQAWIAQQQKQQQQMMEMMLGQLTKLAVGGRASAPARTAERAQPLAPECDGSEDVQAHSGGSLDSQRSLPPPELEPAFDRVSRLDSLYRQKEVEAQQRWERRRMQPRQGQVHTSAREPEPPRAKMPTFEGKDEWDSFIRPFERLAHRSHWTYAQRLDRLHESLRGAAASFTYVQPLPVQEDYDLLCEQLQLRFGRKDPPSTARRKLSERRQGKESTEEFAEEIRRLVARAYPDSSIETQDELAAEAFLGGYRSSRIAYQVMNQEPKTLARALELVDAYEHNFKATVGREHEQSTKSRARQVTWAAEDAPEARRVATPIWATQEDHQNVQARQQEDMAREIRALKEDLQNMQARQQEDRKQWREDVAREIRALKEDLMAQLPNRSRSEGSPGPRTGRSPRELSPRPASRYPSPGMEADRCYQCGERGHFRRDCPRSSSPAPVKLGN